MRRRSMLGAIPVLVTSGCLSFFQDSGPFKFEIVNYREEKFRAELTLWKDDTVVLDGFVDVARKDPTEDAAGISLQNIENVSNGDVIEPRIEIDDRVLEHSYEITCSDSNGGENTLQFNIWTSEDRGEDGMGFDGSRC